MQRIRRAIVSLLALSLIWFLLPVAPVGAVQMQFYDASIEISDSQPTQPANWTLTMNNKQAIPTDGTITIDPQGGEFTIPADMDYTDFDLSVDGTDLDLAALPGSGADTAWGIAVTPGTSGQIVFTNNDTDTVAADALIVIEIGTNATYGVAGTHQIVNLTKDAIVGTGDIWSVYVTSMDATSEIIDTIELLIATIEPINSYAGQKPHMTFTIVGETAPDGGAITSNIIEWREIMALTPKAAVMRIKVNTDAKNGFTVYLKQDHNMQHGGDPTLDIDPIKNGSVGTNDLPVAWTSPTGTTIAVDTGFLGYTTSDATLNNVGDGVNRFTDGTLFAGLTANSEEILFHPEATQSDIEGQDYTKVTFKIEVSNLQPSGNYMNELTFIAKPVF